MKKKRIINRSAESIGLKGENIPENEMGIMSRHILESVAKAFEDPEIKKEYEQWKAERAARA